jgi:hypothetical protein
MSDAELILYCSNCHTGNKWSEMEFGDRCRWCDTIPATWLLYQPPDLDPAANIGN